MITITVWVPIAVTVIIIAIRVVVVDIRIVVVAVRITGMLEFCLMVHWLCFPLDYIAPVHIRVTFWVMDRVTVAIIVWVAIMVRVNVAVVVRVAVFVITVGVAVAVAITITPRICMGMCFDLAGCRFSFALFRCH